MTQFLSAQWRHLVMLNYEVDPEVLRPRVPFGTEIDFYNGKTYLSVVGFLFLKTLVYGIPIPFHRNFEEVNLRFYVRRKDGDGWRRGVVFVKEVVPRWAIAAVARWLYNENYVCCPMTSQIQLPIPPGAPQGSVEYRWQSGSTWNRVSAGIEGTPAPCTPGSEEEFITEHYWGYARQRNGSTMEYRVEHPPWRVWRATTSTLGCDVASFYGPEYASALSQSPTSAFVADGSDIAVYRGEVIR